jgi:hypothetical protein
MHIDSKDLTEVLMQLTWIKKKLDYQESSIQSHHVMSCDQCLSVNILCPGEVGCLIGQLIRYSSLSIHIKHFE